MKIKKDKYISDKVWNKMSDEDKHYMFHALSDLKTSGKKLRLKEVWEKYKETHDVNQKTAARVLFPNKSHGVAESFFSSLKKERIKKRIYKTREMARADVFDYIEMFYNRIRRHSHLDGMSPEAFETASK